MGDATATTGFAIFDTALGVCGIAWSAHGITGVELPAVHADAARATMRRRFPQAAESPAPPAVEHAIDGIVALLAGAAVDLTSAPLDMSAVGEFERRVYDITRTIRPGAVFTYGDIATRLGDRTLARDVGQALGRNPFPIIVPCHRVVAARGKTGGFSGRGGIATKMRLLAIETAHALAAMG